LSTSLGGRTTIEDVREKPQHPGNSRPPLGRGLPSGLPRSIRGLLLLLLALVLVPVLLVQTGIYYTRFEERRAQEYQANLELARSVAATFNAYLADVFRTQIALGAALSMQPTPSVEEANRLLTVSLGAYPSMRYFSWLDAEGRVIASSEPMAIGQSGAGSSYVQEILAGRDSFISELLIGPVSGQPSFVIVTGIRDERGALLGMVSAVVDPERLGAVLRVERPRDGAISLVDRTGRGVYRYPEVQWTWESRNWLPTQPIIGEALAGREAMGTFVSVIDGRERMTGIVPVGDTGWAASANRSTDEAMAPVRDALLRDGLLLLTVAGLAFLGALLTGRLLTAPIERLRRRALDLAEGRQNGRLAPEGPEELAELATTFERMASEIEAREEKLRRSEEHFRQLAVMSPDTIFFQDTELRYSWIVNPVDPLAEADVVGKTDFDLLPAEEAERLTEIKRKVLSTGERVRAEFLLSPGGITRWFEGVYQPWPGPDGRIVGIASYSRDITERREIETERERLLAEQVEARKRIEELAAQREAALAQLQAVVASMTEAVIVVRPGGELVTANPGVLRLYGEEDLPVEELGRLYTERYQRFELYHMDGTLVPLDEWPVARVLRGDVLLAYELGIKNLRTGQLKVASFNGCPVRNQEGEFVLGVLTARDVTEQKEAEHERESLLVRLRSSNQELTLSRMRERELAHEARRRTAELETVVNSIADGLVIYDQGGQIVQMNRVVERILGQAQQPQEGLSLAERAAQWRVETPDGRPFGPEELPAARALRGETVSGVVMTYRRSLGEPTWVSVSAAPLRDGDGKIAGAVATFTDITELRRLHEQQEQWVGMVSHDLRSPLSVVQGQAQLLERMADRPERVRQSAEAIFTSAKRMNVMIQDLVDSARLESGQMGVERIPLDLGSFVLELWRRLGGAMDMNRVSVEIDELPPVTADPGRLERILVNLFSNALKYSPPGSPVVLRAERQGGDVVVSVIDEGPGIAPEDQGRIFERFYRVKGAHRAEGIGLGLYITKMLVEAHGGRVWVESEVGRGSSFHFTLQAQD
jgi:PAS domain S-box-containing protein